VRPPKWMAELPRRSALVSSVSEVLSKRFPPRHNLTGCFEMRPDLLKGFEEFVHLRSQAAKVFGKEFGVLSIIPHMPMSITQRWA
jgi:hypothetical protein